MTLSNVGKSDKGVIKMNKKIIKTKKIKWTIMKTHEGSAIFVKKWGVCCTQSHRYMVHINGDYKKWSPFWDRCKKLVYDKRTVGQTLSMKIRPETRPKLSPYKIKYLYKLTNDFQVYKTRLDFRLPFDVHWNHLHQRWFQHWIPRLSPVANDALHVSIHLHWYCCIFSSTGPNIAENLNISLRLSAKPFSNSGVSGNLIFTGQNSLQIL